MKVVCSACAGTGVRAGTPALAGLNGDCPACRGTGEIDGLESPTIFDPPETPNIELFLSDEEIAQRDADAGWTPSRDQEAALSTLLEAISSSGAYVLDGCAGTGKTTLMKALLRRLTPEWDVVLLAPTWRAANRLREVTGQATSSIHSVVYGAPVQKRCCPCGEWSNDLMKSKSVLFFLDASGDLKFVEDEENPPPGSFALPRYQCPVCKVLHEDATRFPQRLDFVLADAGTDAPRQHRLVVVDEVGMVPPTVRSDLQRTFEDDRTRVLGVGDKNQLPWVKDSGDNTEIPYLSLDRPTVSLTQVHRQAEGDPTLRLAQDLKVHPTPSDVKWPFPFRIPGILIESRVPLITPAQWAASLRCAGEDLALIAFSNKTRAELNRLIRYSTGAETYAEQLGQTLIPGDRLLARGNTSACGVFNGELFTLCEIEPVAGALLNPDGRAQRRHTTYEHDRILEGGASVFRASLSRVGHETHQRISVLLVTPRGPRGCAVVESAMILQGLLPADARQQCRETARAWREEYTAAVKERQGEFEMRRTQAETKRLAEARFLRASTPTEIRNAFRPLRRLDVDAALIDEVDQQARAGAFSGVENRAGVFARFQSPYDVALECESVQDYCEKVYGAVDPDRVVVVDLGEALTCHAMQGSQAAHVGVVFDGPFWGAWRHDRMGALRWAYTAVTRSAGKLALFSIMRENG